MNKHFERIAIAAIFVLLLWSAYQIGHTRGWWEGVNDRDNAWVKDAIRHGWAEYYLDENYDRCLRWKEYSGSRESVSVLDVVKPKQKGVKR